MFCNSGLAVVIVDHKSPDRNSTNTIKKVKDMDRDVLISHLHISSALRLWCINRPFRAEKGRASPPPNRLRSPHNYRAFPDGPSGSAPDSEFGLEFAGHPVNERSAKGQKSSLTEIQPSRPTSDNDSPSAASRRSSRDDE